MRPGCGGFGIRNFLTLFLSIELSKAMVDLNSATAAGNKAMASLAKQRIALFENQLEESNPILTAISDAMTVSASRLTTAPVAFIRRIIPSHNLTRSPEHL